MMTLTVASNQALSQLGLEATQNATNMAYAGYIRTMIATYKSLYQDVSSVSAGAGELSDGVQTLSKKLPTLVNGDLTNYFERLKAVQDYADEYTTFAGWKSLLAKCFLQCTC